MKHSQWVPHPIPYQGSKRALAPEILSRMPRRIDRLVEPFAGSAAISLAAASQRLVTKFWINDAHEALASLWRAILNDPVALSEAYKNLWLDQRGKERQYFDRVRDQFNRTHQPSDFLYLLARCVKAAIRYNSNGQFNNTPDNRRKGARPEEMRARISGAASLLTGRTQVTSLDYREILAKCLDTDVVYMDPPYQGVYATRDQRYAPKVSHDEFADALAELNHRSVMYLVSYDGRCGPKSYGKPLPERLGLLHVELCAGRSTQATLLGRDHVTYESLYISPALAVALRAGSSRTSQRQLAFA
jgi:DNA adenine methylase